MSIRTPFLKVFAALAVLFFLPVAMFRHGPTGAIKRARAAFADVSRDGPLDEQSVYLIETHNEATVGGDVRMDLYGVHGRLGMVAVVRAIWEVRPAKVHQLVFWISEGEPMPPVLTTDAVHSMLDLEHSPRPVAGAEKYINGLVVPDSVRDRIRTLLDLACSYTECPGAMKA